MMKRYLVFCVDNNEANGGLCDLITTLDDINLLEKESYIQENILSNLYNEFIQVLDSKTGKFYDLYLEDYNENEHKSKFDEFIYQIVNESNFKLIG